MDGVGAVFLTKGFRPVHLLPERYRPKAARSVRRELTPEEQAVETKVFFGVLGKYLGQMNGRGK